MDEIQTVTADAAEQMVGTFQLTFNFSGQALTTAPILHDAPAMIRDEGTGAYVGESMQRKLQDLRNVGTVRVVRSVFDSTYGGHTWTITFVSEPGDLEELVALPAGLTAQGSRTMVRTVRHGNANVWYNYKYGLSSIRGRLYPSWLIVLPEDPSGHAWRNLTCLDVPDLTSGERRPDPCPLGGAETLAQAKAAAVFKVRVLEDRREIDFRLPAGVQGRYVRVQLESAEDYLSLSEVQVYGARTYRLRDYTGGSPVTATTAYQPEESLDANFGGMRARGPWILSFADTVPRKTIMTGDGRPKYDAHGRGAIDDWVLVLTDTRGRVRTYHMDVSAVVKTLPVYGKLYLYDNVFQTRGAPIENIKGMHRNNGECIGDCTENGQYGQGIDLSGTISGSLAAYNVVIKDRQVVYSPFRDYLGEDTFSYTSFLGVTESANTGAVTVDVRECRQANCLNDAFGDNLGNLQELWYRAEGEPLTPFVPRSEELLDTSDLVSEPWLHMPVAGMQGGPCGTAGVVCPGDTDQATLAP